MRTLPRALAVGAVSLALSVPAASAIAVTGPATPAATPATNAPAATGSTAPAVQVRAAAGTPDVPWLNTRAWVLADLDSGQILAMRDPDTPRSPASTLKLLMALTVVPRLNPDQPYLATKADEDAEGNRVVLHKGLTYTASDLLRAALLPSANDAATALAKANGGLAVTVEQMNAEAARLGATRTVAANASGLDQSGQQSTARDMAAIGRAALANPEIASYLALTQVDFPGEPGANGARFMYPIYNHNAMLTDGFDGALGGKSGYTSKAGRTFVGAAERNGHRLIVAMLGIGPNTYTTPERLLTWAFANYDRLTPVGQLPEPTGPAPTFERAIKAVDASGAADATAAKPAKRSSDAPTSTEGASTWGVPGLPGLPRDMPSILQILTMLMALVAVLRARVYWIAHRHRSAWVDLEAWNRRAGRAERLRLARSQAADLAEPGDADGPRASDEPDDEPDDAAADKRLVEAPA